MSNSTNNPAAGPQYQPETLNPGQDAAGAVSQSGTASATRPAGPQPHRRATIRRATLPGQDAPAADSGPIPATAPDLPEIVAALQKTAAPAPALPDIVARLQATAAAFEPPKIAKALQDAAAGCDTAIIRLQKTAAAFEPPKIAKALQDAAAGYDSAIIRIKAAAGVCISETATPAGISRQIAFFAGFELYKFSDITAGIYAKLTAATAKITAYFRAELETNPYYFELVADLEKANAEKEAAEKAAALAIAEKEATAAELAKTRAELELYKAAVNLQEVIKQLPAPATAAGPQSGHPAKQPGHPQPPRRADFKPTINKAYLRKVFEGLPFDFNPTEAQFYALFNSPITIQEPIIAKPGQVAAFLQTLFDCQFINNKQFAAVAEKNKCFVNIDGRPIKAKNISQALSRIVHESEKPLEDFEYIKDIAKQPPY